MSISANRQVVPETAPALTAETIVAGAAAGVNPRPKSAVRRAALSVPWGLVVVLALFLVLGVYYSRTVPIFEAPDELHHFFYVRHLASGNPLPVQDPDAQQPWAQEGSQPPLYYALAGLLTSWIPTDDALTVSRPNLHASTGVPLETGNKNVVVHNLALEQWPFRGTVLAVHVARWFSLVLGMATIVCTYAIARRLLPDQPDLAVAAAAINAFIPQFIFISAAVSNDNLIILLASFTVWQLVRLLQRPATAAQLVLLGVTLGLAALSKLSGLGLIGLAVGVLVLQAWREHRWRVLLRELLLTLAPALLVAGWWFWRNWALYGDFTGLNVMLQIVGPRVPPPTLSQLPSEFQGLRISFWGLFGWFSVPFPAWVYTALDILSLLTLAGLTIGVARMLRRAGQHAASVNAFSLRSVHSLYWILLLLSAWIAVITTALVRWTRLTPGTQGRLLFPAISALAILLVLSWSQLLPLRGRLRRAWLAVWPTWLLLLALAAPQFVIAPAYAVPPRLDAGAGQAMPPTALLPQPIRFGEVVQLVGAQIEPDTVHPGESVQVTLYWEALQEMPYDLSLFIRLLGQHNEIAGQIDTYPGWGNYATSLWRPGEIIVDKYRVPVHWDAATPVLLRVDTGLYYAPTQQDVPSLDAAGQPVPAIVGTVRLAGRPGLPVALQRPVDYDFNGLVRLAGYEYSTDAVRPGESITVTLHWQAVAPMGDDFTVFVHLLGPGATSERVAQQDQPPLGGNYPTSVWQPGDEIVDQYVLAVPEDAAPGVYRPLVGLYLPTTLERVQVGSATGDVRDRGAWLGPIEVKASVP